jgi:hypothetical protein
VNLDTMKLETIKLDVPNPGTPNFDTAPGIIL